MSRGDAPHRAAAPAVDRVVLVRGWHDHRGGGGCCGGTAVLDAVRERVPAPTDDDADRTAALYRALRGGAPDGAGPTGPTGVTVVDAGNWAWLLPATYRAARSSGATRAVALRSAARSTTPGAVLVDGRLLRGADEEPVAVVADRVRSLLRARPGTLPV